LRFAIVPERSRVRIDARSSLHPIPSATTGLRGWLELEVVGGANPARAALIGAGSGGLAARAALSLANRLVNR
jgi:hypothetical protein